ncbi:MAG: hypothetical protein IT340_13340 [Chloroflexi bacterium]|nr:hypothetical protein [Chloroflexota bacterium]
MSDTDRPPDTDRHRDPRRTRWTPLERSILPSLSVTAVVLIGLMLLVRVRLPPLPYSLVLVLVLWGVCLVGVFVWQSRRPRR